MVAMGGAFTARLALAAAMCVGGVGLLEGMGPGGAAEGAAAAASAMPVGATLLALLQPVGFGTSYLRIEALMKRFPKHGLQLSSLQLLSNAAIAAVWCAADALLLHGGADGVYDLSALDQPPVIAGILYTGLISTALTVLLQVRAARHPPLRPRLTLRARPWSRRRLARHPRRRTHRATLSQTRALSMLPAADSSVIVATEPLWAAGFAALLLGEVLDPTAQLGGACILLGCLANTVLPADLGLGGAPSDGGEAGDVGDVGELS